MEIMKILYAMITKRCNLSCPHCDIKKNQEEQYNHDKFLYNLRNWNGYRILFGGEPNVVPSRTREALLLCDSISTNLVNISPGLFHDIQEQEIPIATSWNPQRFTEDQYHTWLINIDALSKTNTITCLITLTQDLVDSKGTSRLWDMIAHANNSFSYIQFEQLHDPSKDQSFYDAIDKWLVSMYRETKKRSLTHLFPQFQKNATWKFDCSQTYTMYPDGNIHYGCPEYTTTYVLSRCYQCDHVSVCQPCRLQSCCTRPNRLFEEIQKG